MATMLVVALGPGTPSSVEGAVCGMSSAGASGSSGRAEGDSDLSLSHMADQPAGTVVCSMGYLAEKCGDHVTALKIFDKCIAKGYAGAMIWKGMMYEAGVGLPRDDAAAAALFKRAAESGEGHYAALGKLHYASALYQGKGVPRDEGAARTWFEKAAAEGSEDAGEFLRTGHHTGGRDASGRGVGQPATAVRGRELVRQDDAKPPPERGPVAGVAAAALLVLLMTFGAWRQVRHTPGAMPMPSLRRPRESTAS